jgi:hypothetical protein
MSTKHKTGVQFTAAITCCGVYLPAVSENASVRFEHSSVDKLLVKPKASKAAVFTIRSSLAPCAVLDLMKVFQR